MILNLLRFIIISAALTSIFIVVLFRPTHVSSVRYQGETVNITRNQYSIPFIKAFSKKSFYYGYGWAIAQDRLFQMTFRKTIVAGRLAEFVGEPGLPLDKFMRQINVKYWGHRWTQRLKENNLEAYQIYQAFVDGINDCANSLKTLPLDFHLLGLPWENWKVQDVVSLFKMLQLSQSMGGFQQIFRSSLLQNYTKQEINEILPSTKQNWAFDSKTVIKSEDIPHHLRTNFTNQHQINRNLVNLQKIDEIVNIDGISELTMAQGSNSWAISGNYTESGKPILVSDPHLSNNIPSQFYQIQGCYHKNGRQYCMSGFTSPGTCLVVGKYNYFAMGPTTIYSDCMDFYKQKVQKESYLVDGEWRNLKIRTQTIKIKTSSGIIQELHQVRETHRGPLINYVLSEQASFHVGENISLQWTGANDHYQNLVDALYFSELEDWESLKKMGVQGFKSFVNFNFVFITNDDHIGNIRLGRYPLRKNPEMGNYIKDGTNTENDWIQFLQPQNKLIVVDPPCGYIIAANNKAAEKEYYNDLAKYTIYTARADRIQQMIESQIQKGNKINVETNRKMLGDTIDSYCKRILPVILRVIPKAVDLIGNFDCNFDKNSQKAPIYEVFFRELHKLLKKGNFDKVNLLGNHHNYQYLYNFIKKSESKQQNKRTINLAWKNALINDTLLLKEGLSTPSVRWGAYHKDVMPHLPFSKNSFLSYFYNRESEGQGNLHTVNVGKMGKVEFGNYQVSHRATSRAIYSYNGPSYWIIDSGADQRVYSGHYDDQWSLFMQNELIQIQQYPKSVDAKDQL